MQGVFLAEVGCLRSLSKLKAGWGGVGWGERRSHGLGFLFGVDFSFSYTPVSYEEERTDDGLGLGH